MLSKSSSSLSEKLLNFHFLNLVDFTVYPEDEIGTTKNLLTPLSPVVYLFLLIALIWLHKRLKKNYKVSIAIL